MTSKLKLAYLEQSADRVAHLINSGAPIEEINSAINILEYDVKALKRGEQPWHQREASGLVTLVTLALFIGTVSLAIGIAVMP